MFVLKCII